MMPSNSINDRWTIGAGTMRVECQTGHAEIVGDAASATSCDAVLKTGGSACGLSRTFGPTTGGTKRGWCSRGHVETVASGVNSTCPTLVCGGTRKIVQRATSTEFQYNPADTTLKNQITAILTWP